MEGREQASARAPSSPPTGLLLAREVKVKERCHREHVARRAGLAAKAAVRHEGMAGDTSAGTGLLATL